MEELRPGLWRWTANHPAWEPAEPESPGDWPPEAGSVAYAAPQAFVLIDPLVDGGAWGALDALVERHGSPVAHVVTCPWHVRSGAEVIRRYVNSPGIEAWAHAQAVKDRERIGFQVAHVVENEAQVAPGVEVIATDTGNGELTVWIEEIGAIVAADVLIGAEGERSEALRVCPAAWLEDANDVETVKSALKPLLERDIRAIVPLHGAPVLNGAKAALASALA